MLGTVETERAGIMQALKEIFTKPFIDGDKRGDYIANISKEQNRNCNNCGHDREDHAKEGQGRSRFMCERSGCECGDYK